MSTASPRKDPAASMSQLNQLLRNPLDAAYHAYAADPNARRSGPAMRVLVIIMAIALGIASGIAVRYLRAPADTTVRNSLTSRIETVQTQVDSLSQEVSDLSSTMRSAADIAPTSAPQLEASVAMASAAHSVHGPGLTVALSDATDSKTERPQAVVRDQDLRMVVNAMWAGGAEAIDVNGIRIGSGTFIRTAGSTILVNTTAIQSPYVINAIGDGSDLSVALVRGGTGDYLSTAQSARGIQVTTRAANSIEMQGVDQRSTRYAETRDGAGG